MKIAVIGSGISGLTCAHLLSQEHQVDIYEANDYLGGHTHTVDVPTGDDRVLKIDTGFIVFNDRTYPRFEKLLGRINVVPKDTEMSFSVINQDHNLEYNGHNIDTLFAQRKNLVSLKFYGLIREILRFNKMTTKMFEADEIADVTLGDFLSLNHFKPFFADNYLLPMVGAIWSCSLNNALDFPLQLFIRFFYHHGLLSVSNRPQWYVVDGGSSSYIPELMKSVSGNCYLSTPVLSVLRDKDSVTIKSKKGVEHYDHVIMACHSDQALSLLADPTSAEKDILGSMKYQANDVILHTDTTIMPAKQKAWASWNFRLNDLELQRDQPALITYYMNRLQGLHEDTDYFVSLNSRHLIDPALIVDSYEYHHPVMDEDLFRAQKRWGEVSANSSTFSNTHYCGAYWHNGFHEDGVHSALNVCESFGISL